jgi:anti-anti-sigma factor
VGDAAAGLLRTSVSRSGERAVVRLRGELDVATEPRLRARLLDLLEPQRETPVRHVVVDASQLEFLDLAGLRLLVEAERQVAARGGSLVLSSPSRRVRRLLDVVDPRGRLPVES